MLWLLHGNLGSPADWKPVMDALRSNAIESRALNLWKYLECCPKSLPEMGRVLCSEIAAQDKHPHICGYSLGGRLAMHAVLAHPPSGREPRSSAPIPAWRMKRNRLPAASRMRNGPSNASPPRGRIF
ncbi:hypothetical protein [Akkermansia sp.]|uniref:hypothetical protein n=1 Tax=Akkermansia sp. TaxID=1872421 RepID=UPI003AB56CC7